MMRMKSWNDHLSEAITAAEQEGATRTEVEDAIDEMMMEYDWAPGDDEFVEDEVPDEEEDSGEEEGQTDSLPPR
jgi:hypothetical protein